MYLTCHVISKGPYLNGHVTLWADAFTLSHHLALFGVHQSSAIGDVTYLTCPMTSQQHVTEGKYGFMGRSSPLCLTILPGLLAIGIVVVEK